MHCLAFLFTGKQQKLKQKQKVFSKQKPDSNEQTSVQNKPINSMVKEDKKSAIVNCNTAIGRFCGFKYFCQKF